MAALTALGPRDAGTAGGARAAAWIAEQLRQAGVRAQTDTFTNDTPAGTVVCRNVIAELPPRTRSGQTSSPSPAIVLLSHFDTKSGIATNFVGANDGGSSTGLLLELAARLAARGGLDRRGVLLGFVDGEECLLAYGPHDGLLGSRHLAGHLAANHRPVRAAILMDMIGDRNLNIEIPSNSSRDLTLLALRSAEAVGVREKFGLANGGVLDDHQPFLDAGFPAIDLIDFAYGSAPGRNDYWHSPQDTVDKLSVESLTAVGNVVAEMLARLDAQ